MIKNTFDDLNYRDQEALKKWFNKSELDEKEKKLLFDLLDKKKFSHWECPFCDEKIRVGYPESWYNFQGVNQSEHRGLLCQNCATGCFYLMNILEEEIKTKEEIENNDKDKLESIIQRHFMTFMLWSWLITIITIIMILIFND